MGYFPFFMDLADEPGLIVGGGKVAARKLEKLLPYGPRLTVIAPDLEPSVREAKGVTLLERPYCPEDLEADWRFVIAATDCRAVNREIALRCGERRILVDVADGGEEGSFLFPALVKRGRLSVGISTGGASPTAAAYVKEQVAQVLPERFEEILDYLETLRERLKQEEADPTCRSALLAAAFRACAAAGRPLETAELATLREKKGVTP